MYLSKFQQTVVKKIVSGNIFDVQSFIEEMLTGKFVDCNRAVHRHGEKVFCNQPTSLFITDNQEQSYIKCKEFKLLIVALHKNDLIVLSEKPSTSSTIKLNHFGTEGTDPPKVNHSLDSLLDEYFLSDIIPYTSLNEFIANEYLTPHEVVLKDEKRARIISQRWTIAIAVFTLLVSTILNIFFRSDNKVQVEVLPPLPDTIQIKIIEPVEVKHSEEIYSGKNNIDTLENAK